MMLGLSPMHSGGGAFSSFTTRMNLRRGGGGWLVPRRDRNVGDCRPEPPSELWGRKNRRSFSAIFDWWVGSLARRRRSDRSEDRLRWRRQPVLLASSSSSAMSSSTTPCLQTQTHQHLQPSVIDIHIPYIQNYKLTPTLNQCFSSYGLLFSFTVFISLLLFSFSFYFGHIEVQLISQDCILCITIYKLHIVEQSEL